jgi:hypothetical protein
VLHGVDTVPLNIAFTYRNNVHFVRIRQLIATVRHLLLPCGRHRSRVVAEGAGVLGDRTAVFGDGIQATACSSVCELPTSSSACNPHCT